jgi:hypothetical protein
MSQEPGKLFPYVPGFWEDKYDDLNYQLTVTEPNNWYHHINEKFDGAPTEKVISYLLFLLTDTIYGAGKHQNLPIPRKMILALQERRHDEETMREIRREAALSFLFAEKEPEGRVTVQGVYYATSFFLPDSASDNLCVLWHLLHPNYPQDLVAERDRLGYELYHKRWEQTKQDKERIHKALHGNVLALHPYGLEMQKYVEDKVKEILKDVSMSPKEHLDTMIERATPEHLHRFLLTILSDETHGVLRHASAGSLSHFAISNAIASFKTNCKDPKTWEEASIYALKPTHCTRKVSLKSSNVMATLSAHEAAQSVRAELREASGGAKQAKAIAAGAAAQWAAKAAGEGHYQWMTLTLGKILKEEA